MIIETRLLAHAISVRAVVDGWSHGRCLVLAGIHWIACARD